MESVTRSVRMVLNVSMDIVGMPECFFKVNDCKIWCYVSNTFYEQFLRIQVHICQLNALTFLEYFFECNVYFHV